MDYKDIFISYRRDTGSTLANIIKAQVEAKSAYTCFLDIDNLQAGSFRDKLEPNIQQSKAILIVISEKHLERCANFEDVCVQELECAIKHNKKIIIVTELQRSQVRKLIGSIPNLPESVKNLGKFNMFYMRVGDAIHETIARIIDSMAEDSAENLELAANSLRKAMAYKVSPNRIYISMYEFIYTGPRVGDYLTGFGKLVCRDVIDVVIEGHFNCPISEIGGDLKISIDGVQLFAGKVSKIDSIRPLKVTGNGTFVVQGSVYTGNLVEGLPEGYAELYKDITKSKYTGFFKDGKKNGNGTLVINNGTTLNAILHGSFKHGTPYGEVILVDNRSNTTVRFNTMDNKIISYAALTLSKEKRIPFSTEPNTMQRKNQLDYMKESVFTITFDANSELQEIIMEHDSKIDTRYRKVEEDGDEFLEATMYPKDSIIREVRVYTCDTVNSPYDLFKIEIFTDKGRINATIDVIESIRGYNRYPRGSNPPWNTDVLPVEKMANVFEYAQITTITHSLLFSSIESLITFTKIM